MGFNLRSGNTSPFKTMGSSPVKKHVKGHDGPKPEKKGTFSSIYNIAKTLVNPIGAGMNYIKGKVDEKKKVHTDKTKKNRKKNDYQYKVDQYYREKYDYNDENKTFKRKEGKEGSSDLESSTGFKPKIGDEASFNQDYKNEK